jgi:hypothetical protein
MCADIGSPRHAATSVVAKFDHNAMPIGQSRDAFLVPRRRA